jgi:hypothetical protein
MRIPAPMILGPNDVVTKRCKNGHPMQFVRDFGVGGQVTCTPIVADGVPLCAVCISDDDLLRLIQAGVVVEMEN